MSWRPSKFKCQIYLFPEAGLGSAALQKLRQTNVQLSQVILMFLGDINLVSTLHKNNIISTSFNQAAEINDLIRVR